MDNRFWKFVDKSKACWEWTGAKDKNGYGVFKTSVKDHGARKTVKAHRFAYELTFGPIGSLFACHLCDNPGCVNPRHIFLGTAKDNNLDRIRKGRPNLGNKKISDETRTAILVQSDLSQRELARIYGVSKTQIARIQRQRR